MSEKFVCHHGHLRRQCPECELTGVIRELHAALEEASPYLHDCKEIGGYKKGMIEATVRKVDRLVAEMRGYAEDEGGSHA